MIVAAVVIAVWSAAVMVCLRANHVCSVANAVSDDLPEIPSWAAGDFWTQDRVDAQFRAITLPISR